MVLLHVFHKYFSSLIFQIASQHSSHYLIFTQVIVVITRHSKVNQGGIESLSSCWHLGLITQQQEVFSPIIFWFDNKYLLQFQMMPQLKTIYIVYLVNSTCSVNSNYYYYNARRGQNRHYPKKIKRQQYRYVKLDQKKCKI